MASRESQNGGWKNCETGEITRLVGALKSRRRIQFARRAASVATVVVLLIGSTVFFSRPEPTAMNYGGISCEQVIANAAQFVRGELSRATADRIQLHLEHCEPCRRKIERMRASSERNARRQPSHSRVLQASAGNVSSSQPTNGMLMLAWNQQ